MMLFQNDDAMHLINNHLQYNERTQQQQHTKWNKTTQKKIVFCNIFHSWNETPSLISVSCAYANYCNIINENKHNVYDNSSVLRCPTFLLILK